MEADFTQYYQADLRNLWRRGSGMTVRWVIVHLLELPMESRIKQHYAEGRFDREENLLCDVRDMLVRIQYFSAITAMKEMKTAQQQKVLRGVPEPPRRPGDPEPEVKFASKEELQQLFPQKSVQRRLEQRRQRRLGRT